MMYLLVVFVVIFGVYFVIKQFFPQEELSEKSSSILSTRKDELDAASRQWKSRVEKSDADAFSVAGRMQNILPDIGINNQLKDKVKKTPRAKRFKGKDGR